MRKRVLVSALSSLVLITSLTGCAGDMGELQALRSMEANYTTTSDTTNYKMSYTEQQQMIYAQVSDRKLLDLSTLSPCTDNEIQQVTNYMNTVDNILIGQAEPNEDTIDPCFTNYLLAQFEQTPYYWQRTRTIIRGVDDTSKAVIVDVTYNTIDFAKEVKDDSHITKGDPDYDRKMEVRYTRYINILDALYRNNDVGKLSAEAALNEFESVYGDIDDIYNEQRNLTLTEDIFETGNQRTYTGLVNNSREDNTGTMTVRYVLVPKFVLGINLGIECKHMYVTDYRIDNDFTEGLSTFNLDGYQEAANSVYAKLYSFFTCIDESDYQGLYKLCDNFSSLDKYYADMFETTYSKHENITLSIFDITGTHITCAVKAPSRIRARGSNMTYPSYDDRYYFEIDLVDDELKIKECILLSRTLTGEPDIITGEADLAGFVSLIELDNEDKLAIEKLLCDFGTLQLNSDTLSNAFSEVVDISIPQSDLSTLKSNMMSLNGKQKSVFLVNYQQGTSNYASVKCREQYQQEDNSIIEAEVTYDFLFVGGQWKISGYTINGSGRLDTTNLSTVGALCLLEPGKVVSYTSQVKGTQSVDVDSLTDVSVTLEHKEYTPQLKTGSQEQGLKQVKASDITDDMIYAFAEEFGFDYDEYTEMINTILESEPELTEEELETLTEFRTIIVDTIVIQENIRENLYTSSDDVEGLMDEIKSRYYSYSSVVNGIKDADNEDVYKSIGKLYNDLGTKLSVSF